MNLHVSKSRRCNIGNDDQKLGSGDATVADVFEDLLHSVQVDTWKQRQGHSFLAETVDVGMITEAYHGNSSDYDLNLKLICVKG